MDSKFERGLNGIVGFVTRSRYGVATTTEFRNITSEIKDENATGNVLTRFYNAGTLVVIDDKNLRIFPRFRIVKKDQRNY